MFGGLRKLHSCGAIRGYQMSGKRPFDTHIIVLEYANNIARYVM